MARILLEKCSWDIESAVEMYSTENQTIQDAPSSPRSKNGEPGIINDVDPPSSPMSNSGELPILSAADIDPNEEIDAENKTLDETAIGSEEDHDLSKALDDPSHVGSDEEPETNKALVDDIFGNSDDEEEFEVSSIHFLMASSLTRFRRNNIRGLVKISPKIMLPLMPKKRKDQRQPLNQ